MPGPLPSRDTQLVQIVDAALADAARRSGEWLACKLGCTQCCIGVFAINALDALRLQQGLAELDRIDPERAERVRQRARISIDRMRSDFPGDAVTGVLEESDEAAARFDDFANEEPCPALDPATGGCDLYASRPMTCRVFGPPIQSEEGLAVCELCYHGASDADIAACEMKTSDAERLEAELVAGLDQGGRQTRTIVAFALVR